jgi:hypothetical protein
MADVSADNRMAGNFYCADHLDTICGRNETDDSAAHFTAGTGNYCFNHNIRSLTHLFRSGD